MTKLDLANLHINKKFKLEPEVAGKLGTNTVMDVKEHPPIVYKLHYEFYDWLGDDILETFPCFICTERLASILIQNKLTGFLVEDCEISKAELFEDINPGRELPKFIWLKIHGSNNDDFSVDSKANLIVSEKALKILQQLNLNHCGMEEFG